MTIREGEERGICGAALKEHWTIIDDQIEERGVVLLVLNKESRNLERCKCAKTLLRGDQLKYIDVEGVRVVTNKCCAADQIRSDKVKNVATGEVKRRECGKFGKSQNFEQHRDGWGQKMEKWKS